MIRVITGCMFSGKSTKLVGIALYLKNKNIQVFKPKIDTRDNGILKSRNRDISFEATLIENLEEIPQKLKENVKIIIIDETQFLKGDISTIVNLHLKGYDFIVAGLNLTSERKPFGIMKDFLSIATKVEVLYAKCAICGEEKAIYTKYLGKEKSEDVIVSDDYYPICRKCLKEVENI